MMLVSSISLRNFSRRTCFLFGAAFHSFISGEVGTMNDDASNDDSLSLIGKLDSSVEIFPADYYYYLLLFYYYYIIIIIIIIINTYTAF